MFSRRHSLKLLVLSLVAAFAGLPKKALSANAPLPPPDISLNKRLQEILKGRKPIAGKIKLRINPIIEDGSIVPLKIDFAALFSDADPLASIDLIVDKNPDPLIFSVQPNPDYAAGLFHTRIRMRQSSRVAVYASTQGGQLYFMEQEVSVTAGGCN